MIGNGSSTGGWIYFGLLTLASARRGRRVPSTLGW